MIDTSRLKACLAKRGISQAELARRVGLQQSTINLLFNGRSQSSTKLRDIARELHTTAAYLEGLTDDPESEIADVGISFEERQLITLTRALDREDFEALAHLVRSLARAASLGTPTAVREGASATLHDHTMGFSR